MGFLVELDYLRPRELLGDRYPIHSLIRLENTDEIVQRNPDPRAT